MHGPYRARVRLDGYLGVTLELDEAELALASRTAERFYQDASPALAEGALRCAVFYVAELLDAGEGADVEIVGRVGTEGASRKCQASAYGGDHRYCSRCEGTGRETARDSVYRTASVRRDDEGRMRTTLGSRFNERVFGV